MKKIYMVKKNPNMPESEDNWIIMNGYEFARFMETEDGQSRKKNFAQLDACGDEDDIIIAECGEKRAKEWRAEKDAHDYLRECEIESGIETVSFYSTDVDGEEINLEDVVGDPDVDVVADVIKKVTHEALVVALQKLSESEYDLIYHLYLSEHRMTESEYGEIHDLTQQAIHYRKMQVLQTLKNYF